MSAIESMLVDNFTRKAEEMVESQREFTLARASMNVLLDGSLCGSSKTNLYPVPEDTEFDVSESGFISAPGLERLASLLIGCYAEKFDHLSRLKIRYAWKRKGGTSKGKAKFGAVQAITGAAQFVSGEQVEYLVWVGADNVRDNNFTEYQVEALLFHELCHFGFVDGELCLVGHDFEGFADELGYYGLWNQSIKNFGAAVAEPIQRSLFE